MENHTTETTIALLSQSLSNIEKTLGRIEGRMDKYEEMMRVSISREEVEKEFVSKETYANLVDKVGAVTKLLWIVATAVIAEGIHLAWTFIRGAQ